MTDLEIIKEVKDVISDIKEVTDHVIIDQLESVVSEMESRCTPIKSPNSSLTKSCNAFGYFK
jgi:hypothetical protein